MTLERKNMEREVKPCPFCGRQPRVSANDAHNGRLYCDCINDDGTVGRKTWNTRFVKPKAGMNREALAKVIPVNFKDENVYAIVDLIIFLGG